jgi:hypothetical protein
VYIYISRNVRLKVVRPHSHSFTRGANPKAVDLIHQQFEPPNLSVVAKTDSTRGQSQHPMLRLSHCHVMVYSI